MYSIHHNNNPLNQLDKGWFHCYKIILIIYFVLVALGTVIMSAYVLYIGGQTTFLTGNLTTNFLFLLLLTWQHEAIEKKDLDTARKALIGFTFYLVLDICYIFGMSYALYGSIGSDFTIQACAALGVFVVCVFFGSVQVYLFLKKNQSGGYRNMNHIAP